MLTATTYLVLLIALLDQRVQPAERFQIENDLHVVTKPVRAGDIVLGRILGFTIVGTVLLAIMAAVQRRLRVADARPHAHGEDRHAGKHLRRRAAKSSARKAARRPTSSIRTKSRSIPDGSGLALSTNEHEHAITSQRAAAAKRSTTSAARTACCGLACPYYGKLRFLDRKGVDVAKGISVGSEWTYRSFIEGGTPAAAIWTFSGINESIAPQR